MEPVRRRPLHGPAPLLLRGRLHVHGQHRPLRRGGRVQRGVVCEAHVAWPQPHQHRRLARLACAARHDAPRRLPLLGAPVLLDELGESVRDAVRVDAPLLGSAGGAASRRGRPLLCRRKLRQVPRRVLLLPLAHRRLHRLGTPQRRRARCAAPARPAGRRRRRVRGGGARCGRRRRAHWQRRRRGTGCGWLCGRGAPLVGHHAAAVKVHRDRKVGVAARELEQVSEVGGRGVRHHEGERLKVRRDGLCSGGARRLARLKLSCWLRRRLVLRHGIDWRRG